MHDQMPVMDGIEAVRRYRVFEVATWAEEDKKGSIDNNEESSKQHRKRLPIIGKSYVSI